MQLNPNRTKRSLADLAAKFTPKNEGNTQTHWKLFFNFWKAPVGSTSVVRFLPDADETNPMGFLLEHATHELFINGKKITVACPKHRNGGKCPICEMAAGFYDKNSENFENPSIKPLYRKKSYLGEVMVLETPLAHDAEQLVKLIEFGPQVFKQIQAAFQADGDLEEQPYEVKGGYNFRIRKTQTGSGQNSYSTSNFAPKQSDLADDLIEKIELLNLADYLPPVQSYDELKGLLEAHLNGTAAPESAEGEPEAQLPTPNAPLTAVTGKKTVELLKARNAALRAGSQDTN